MNDKKRKILVKVNGENTNQLINQFNVYTIIIQITKDTVLRRLYDFVRKLQDIFKHEGRETKQRN